MNKQIKKFSKTQIITLTALMWAIILLFVLVPIQIGTLQLAFIPIIAVILSAEFMGLKYGAINGLFFGIVSLCNQFIHPSVLAQAFYNPLVSIVPRILIGVVSYLVCHGLIKAIPKLPKIIAYGIGSACGVITNTTLVLGMILAFNFGKTFGTVLVGWEWIVATITGNFIIELIICTLITPPIVFALKKALKIDIESTHNKQSEEKKDARDK